MSKCAWPKPHCEEEPTQKRQMLEYCPEHAYQVDINRGALIAHFKARKSVGLEDEDVPVNPDYL